MLPHALELRVGRRFLGHHPVAAWLIEHSADMLAKYLVGDDWKTAYEMIKGKKYDKQVVELGESAIHAGQEEDQGEQARPEVG